MDGTDTDSTVRCKQDVVCIGRGSYRVSVGIPGGKRPITRRRRRWDEDSNMDLTEIRWKAWSGFIYLMIWTVGAIM